MPKGLREHCEAPEADDAALWLTTLSNGLQGIEDLKTNLATTLIVGMEVKTCETFIAHVEAYIENTPQPPTWCTKCRWVSCCKNMGTTQRTQRYRTQGLYV
jgi:hypothetical protein